MSTAKSEKTVNRKRELHHHHHQHHHNQFASDDSGNFTGSMFTEGDGSHVTMLSPRRDPASSVAGLTEDGCHTSAVSLSEYLTAPSTPRNQAGEHGESYLKTIFDNFNELYHDKMAWIDENIPGGDTPAHVMAKKNVLEHWVSDVIEQNNILVQTVEELESEAERKVQNLQKKVQEAAEMAKEHMNMIKEYEEQIKHLIKEKNIVAKQEEFFRKESMYLEKEKRRALDRLHTLETDNASLVVLINRIRDMGVWDINGLEFAPRTYDSVFGLYPSLPGSEVQTVFTREKTRNLEKAENNVAQLMAQVEELHDRKNEAERLLTEKTKITEELQNDIKELHLKIKQYQDEHQDFKKSLKETQEQLKAATLKNSRPSTADVKREAEMKKMLTELKDLRNQLNIACSERQQAMKESNALKTDLKGRISQMEEMKQLLEQLQTESATTRTAVQDVQDKQDQMSSLKDKVSFYEASYENSNVLLEAKSEVIVKLQSQMEQLHDKVTRLEQSRSCSPNPAATASKMPHARSLSPTPPARQPSRPASHPPSHPASRANSQPSTNVVPILRVPGTPSPKKVGRKDAVARKPTVKVKKTTAVPKPSKTAAEARSQHFDLKKHMQSYSNKPPWNDHFVRAKKPPSPRPSSDKGKHYSASKLVTEIKSVGTTKHGKLDLSVSALSSLTVDKLDDKRSFSESKHQSVSGTGEASHPTVNRIIADYLGQPDSGKLSSATEKTGSKRTLERVKLPPIPTKSDTTTSPHPSTKAYEKTIEEQHLPRIIVKEKKSHTSHTIDTLENLMEVCVKASRELNKAPEGDTTSKSTPKYRVIAGHSHRRRNHRSRENTYTVEALPKTKTKSDLPTPSSKTLQEIKKVDEGKPSKGKSATKFKEAKDANNNNATTKKESESESLSDLSQFRRVAVHPQAPKAASHVTVEDKSPDIILAELPKVSLDYLVKKWIVSSPTPLKKVRKPRSSSPDKSKHHHRSKYSSDNRPDSRGKSKSSGPVNLKSIAADDWGRKQEQVVQQHPQHHHHHHHHHQNPETTTHSDATGDRDSGHLSDFSDWWNWNGNDNESMANDKEVQQNDCEMRMMSSELSTYESVGLGSPQREIERVQQLLAENQKLREQNSKLEQLKESIRADKEASEETHRKELEDKDVEITMQKLPSGRGDGPSCGIGVQVVDLEEACANFQCKVVESVKELRSTGEVVGELGEEAKRLKKEHLLYRSYALFSQLEEEQEEYVGEGMELKELDKVVPDRILEDVGKLEEAVRILQGHVTAKISVVDHMALEFGNVKRKMDMLTSDFRRVISEAQEENQRLMKVVDKMEKKQAEIDELLVMENEIRSLEDDVTSQDFGVLLTEKRLGVIQQSYDKLSHELVRRDDLISQQDSKIAELEAHIRESEAKKTERECGHDGLGIVLRHPPPSSPCSDAEQIQRLIWLTTSLRRKLKKKKEHEEELKKEKQVVFRLASAISSTWEAVRNAYEQLQAESCQLKKSVCEPGIQSEIHQRPHPAYVEEGGGDECGAHRGPAVIPSLPYSNSVSGTSMFDPPGQSQGSFHGSVGIASISSGTLDPENVRIVPVPPSLWSPNNNVNKQSAIETSREPCVHNPDTCIYLKNIVKALEECHNRIKEEVAAHS